MGEYLTTSEIAARLGLSRVSVVDAIARGRLRARKVGRDWLATLADVVEWRNNLYARNGRGN